MIDLTGKVALVTGASRGIGAKTALELAKNGAFVAINYCHEKESALEIANLIKEEYGQEALVVQADVSQEKEVERMVATVVSHYGKIDILVNNAGIAIDTLVEDKTVEDFRKIIDVNLIGTFLVTKYVGEIMMKNRYGKIINVSSTNGIDTYYPMSMDYDASKAGVISLTHNFALHYAPYLNVNVVAPGWVKTDMNKELDEEFIKSEEANIYLKRFAEPEEIAKVIVFLASDAASYVNNAVIRVDGGF